jgi:hypothetical protein
MNVMKAQSQRRRVTAAAIPARKLSRGWLLTAGLGALAIFAFLVVLGGVLIIGAPAGARAATLSEVQGVVEVASSADAGDWTVAEEGQRVREGAAIRTRIDSGATLVFFEGSRAAIGAEADVVIRRLNGGWDRSLKLLIEQTAGETNHQVVKLRGSGAFYEVLTPAGMARVHGTAFQVDVNPLDGVRYVVDHGVVAVSQGDRAVTLTAGQATLVQEGGGPDDPAFEFGVQGEITEINDNVWVVNGLSIQVSAELGAGFVVGDRVMVRGRILEDGTFVADRVSYANNEQNKLHFTGVVEEIGTDAWVISGKTVKVDGQTEIDDDLKVGDPVSVSFMVLADGSWLALEIEALEVDEEKEPTPTASVTSEVTPTATLEQTETPEATETSELTGTPTATPTFTETPTVTETPQMTETPVPTLEGNKAGCERTDWQQPEGLRLAQRWGVSYEEIMGWFCQGYGFGEIDLAYELAQQSGKPVNEVFAMRASGMGWGNIKKALEPQSTPAPNKEKPTKAPNPHKKNP